jgi:general stress protein 26
MLETIPETHQYLLKDESKAYAFVAAVMPNGGPQLTCVWFNTDGEHILFNTMDFAAKHRYFKENDKIAVAIFDGKDPNKYVQIRGTVEMTGEGAVEHTHALSRKYTGKDFELREGTVRVMYKVTPEKLTVWPPASWG